MEKKWWYIRGAQISILFFLSSMASFTGAKAVAFSTTKKSKPGITAKTSTRGMQPRQALPLVRKAAPLFRSSGKHVSRGGKPDKQLASQKSQVSPKRTTVRTALTRKNGKKIALSTSSARFARLTASRATKKMAKRQWGNRSQRRFQVDLSRRAGVAAVAGLSSRQVLLENNYDPVDSTTLYSPETAPFLIQVNNERLPYRLNSVFTLPGETTILSIGDSRKKNEFTLQTSLNVTQIGPNAWSWKAPREVGLYSVKILHPAWGATAQLNVFVMVPFSQVEEGYINGYRVGNYPTTPLRELTAYTLPRGFIEVTEANRDTRVSPHFRLRQFLCKQESEYPKYIILDPRLLSVLETILKKINDQGRSCPTLSIMSGYRTPYYNRAIGNSTTYSRHLWGDAADIFIDAAPRDGEMDDLNRDGEIDLQDTETLYNIVQDLYAPPVQRFLAGSFFNEPILQTLVANGAVEDQRVQRLITGGLARYRENGAHGPFVHVDVRGVFTRWGR